MEFEPSEAVRHWGKYAPSATALVLDGAEISYRNLDRAVGRLAAKARDTFGSHQRIAVGSVSKSNLLISILALARLGKSSVIVHPHNDTETIRGCLTEAKVSAAIVDVETRKRGNLWSAFGGCRLLETSGELEAGDGSDQLHGPLSVSPTVEWSVFYSSGTTGAPKGIVRDQYSVVVELLGWVLELGLEPRTCFYMGRPIFYTGGLLLTLSTLLGGGTVVLPENELWERYQEALGRREIDFAFFIPSQVREFVTAARQSGSRPLRANTIVVMGELIRGEEKLAARESLGSEIIESWGNTEGLGTITRPEDLDVAPDSIGRPFLTDIMFIVDDAGRVLPARRVGRLAGAVEAGFTEYCGRAEDTAAVRCGDIMISDDMGYVDEDGLFYVLGRTGEVVVTAGGTVVLSMLESELREAGVVREICIVKVDSPNGEEFAAGIVLSSGTVGEVPGGLLDAINGRMPPEVVVRRLVTFDRLPRTPTGKLMRYLVADALKSGA